MKRFAWLPLVLAVAGCDILGHSCTDDFRFGLLVIVVDSASGGLITPERFTLILSEGSFVDSTTVTNQTISNPVALAGERPGVYRLEIRATGFRNWAQDGIRVTEDECHVRPVELRARLQRLAAAP